jgi:hypothetical protein
MWYQEEPKEEAIVEEPYLPDDEYREKAEKHSQLAKSAKNQAHPVIAYEHQIAAINELLKIKEKHPEDIKNFELGFKFMRELQDGCSFTENNIIDAYLKKIWLFVIGILDASKDAAWR